MTNSLSKIDTDQFKWPISYCVNHGILWCFKTLIHFIYIVRFICRLWGFLFLVVFLDYNALRFAGIVVIVLIFGIDYLFFFSLFSGGPPRMLRPYPFKVLKDHFLWYLRGHMMPEMRPGLPTCLTCALAIWANSTVAPTHSFFFFFGGLCLKFLLLLVFLKSCQFYWFFPKN